MRGEGVEEGIVLRGEGASRYTRTGCNYDANADAGIIRRIWNEMCGADGGKHRLALRLYRTVFDLRCRLGFLSLSLYELLIGLPGFRRFHFNSWKQLVDGWKRFWIVTIIHCEECWSNFTRKSGNRINIFCSRDFDLGWWSTIRFLANSSSFPILVRMKRTIRERGTSPMGSAQGLVSGSLGCDCFSSRGKLCDTPPPTRWIRNGRSNLRSARYYLCRVHACIARLGISTHFAFNPDFDDFRRPFPGWSSRKLGIVWSSSARNSWFKWKSKTARKIVFQNIFKIF